VLLLLVSPCTGCVLMCDACTRDTMHWSDMSSIADLIWVFLPHRTKKSGIEKNETTNNRNRHGQKKP